MATIAPHEIAEKLKLFYTLVRNDYEVNSGAPQTTFLYKMFGDEGFLERGYFDQLVAALTKSKTDPSFFEIRLGWDIDPTKFPSASVYMEMESKSPNNNAIGTGVGRQPPLIDTVNSTFAEKLQRTNRATCGILITTTNAFEIELLYAFFFRALIMLIPFFEQDQNNCLSNIELAGNSIAFDGRIPEGAYAKVISMSFDYIQSVPSINADPLITQLSQTINLC